GDAVGGAGQACRRRHVVRNDRRLGHGADAAVLIGDGQGHHKVAVVVRGERGDGSVAPGVDDAVHPPDVGEPGGGVYRAGVRDRAAQEDVRALWAVARGRNAGDRGGRGDVLHLDLGEVPGSALVTIVDHEPDKVIPVVGQRDVDRRAAVLGRAV